MGDDRHGEWSRTSVERRLAWAAKFRAAVAGDAEVLCGLAEQEVGKSAWETTVSDLAPLLAACRWHERHAASVLGARGLGGAPLFGRGTRVRVEHVPLGRVAIIATWNYPVQLLGIQLLQALVAGNTVVVKPSEHAPRTQERLIQLAESAGLPAGTISVRPATRDAGRTMLETERFDHVVFTGSTGVGRTIAEQLAGTLTPSTLELSGCDSALVLADADADLAARCIWDAVVLNAGQTCMAPRRALVDRAVYRLFLSRLAPLAAGAKPVRLISREAVERAHGFAAEAVRSGASSLSGVLEPPGADGRSMRPVAIVDCPPDAPLVRGEHFGPVIAVVPVAGLEEAVRLHAGVPKKLATSVFTRSVRLGEELAPRLGSGVVTINDVVLPTAHPGVSITGSGLSGWNPSRGPEGLRALTRAVHVSVTRGLLRPPTGVPSSVQARQVSRFLLWWYGAGRRSPLPPPTNVPVAPAPGGEESTRAGRGAARAHPPAETQVQR
jgi:acyl-CoA reductase-like NAD-dependent aldehyde dehydrogenase